MPILEHIKNLFGEVEKTVFSSGSFGPVEDGFRTPIGQYVSYPETHKLAYEEVSFNTVYLEEFSKQLNRKIEQNPSLKEYEIFDITFGNDPYHDDERYKINIDLKKLIVKSKEQFDKEVKEYFEQKEKYEAARITLKTYNDKTHMAISKEEYNKLMEKK